MSRNALRFEERLCTCLRPVLPTFMYHYFFISDRPAGKATFRHLQRKKAKRPSVVLLCCFAGKIAINIKVQVNKFTFTRNRNNIFILASLTHEYQLLKERICSYRNKFFALQ